MAGSATKGKHGKKKTKEGEGKGLSLWLAKSNDPSTPSSSPSTNEKSEVNSAMFPKVLFPSSLSDSISSISPEKRDLAEEIDTEDDDSEFEETKQSSKRKKTAKARKKLQPRSMKSKKKKHIEGGTQSTIKAFCMISTPEKEKTPNDTNEQVSASVVEDDEIVEESITSTQNDNDIPLENSQANDEVNNSTTPIKTAFESTESIVPETPHQTSQSQEVEASSQENHQEDTTKSGTTPQLVLDTSSLVNNNTIDLQQTPNKSQSKQQIDTEDSDSVVLLMSSGRPKRRAVFRTEELKKQQQEQHHEAIITPATRSIGHSNKKKKHSSNYDISNNKEETIISSSSSCSSDSPEVVEVRKTLVFTSKEDKGDNIEEEDDDHDDVVALSKPRKRKLEMEKKTSVGKLPSKKKAATFFMRDEEKKRLKELEAVSSFREEMRKTREKDQEIFGGRQLNPFFMTRKSSFNSTSSQSNSPMVVDMTIDEEGEKKLPQYFNIKWKKQNMDLFPTQQHIFQMQLDDEEDEVDFSTMKYHLKSKVVVEETPVGASNLSLKNWCSILKSRVDSIENACISPYFWVDNCDFDLHNADVADASSSLPPRDEDALIEWLVEAFHLKEYRVRRLHDVMLAACSRRNEQMSFVDIFSPQTSKSFMGNKDTIRQLLSWLEAWKEGANRHNHEYDSDYDDDFENSSDDDDYGESRLAKLFLLFGESGTGKSASVYACANELGYKVIEINASQSRSGKQVMEIIGEATQSTRVLHMKHARGSLTASKTNKKKKPSKQKRKRLSLDMKSSSKNTTPATSSHLSIVLFEDIDLLFEEDKGFLSSVVSLLKKSKSPIIATCSSLEKVPDGLLNIPSSSGKILKRPLQKVSTREFCVWLLLLSHVQGLQITKQQAELMAEIFRCDVRKTLLFIQAHVDYFSHSDQSKEGEVVAKEKQKLVQWCMLPEANRETMSQSIIDLDNSNEDVVVLEKGRTFVEVLSQYKKDLYPGKDVFNAWGTYKLAPHLHIDPVLSNFLPEVVKQVPFESSGKVTKERLEQELPTMENCADIAEVMSLVEDLTVQSQQSTEYHHLQVMNDRVAIDVRLAALALTDVSTLLVSDGQECIRRNLVNSFQAKERKYKVAQYNDLGNRLELLSAGRGRESLNLDYMPFLARLAEADASTHEGTSGRRRTSRRNHYLRHAVNDLSHLEEIMEWCTYDAGTVVADDTT